ncbi:N-acetylglucosamine-6-phosphate deacetylase [Paenibacillus sp. GCM10027626]|uniref:N-acetylglucosamine-6-phosphate deacetylase n=1 Tax=Paenibacillus sp. GCM10027626 TaxID=3273411 RepID=UPI00363EFB1C
MSDGNQVTAIVHAKLVTPHSVIDNGVIVVKDGRIAECGSHKEIAVPEDAFIIDAEGQYAGPGFIDIHCHGGGGHWAWEEPYLFALSHLKHGTTGILPTLFYNQSRENMLEGVRNVVQMEKQPFSSAIVGMHLEGPYINPKYGAITSPIRPPDPDEYHALLELAGDRIKVWTLAPELPGQEEFAEAAAKYDIALSVGHSEADAETIFSFVRYGLQIGCHCTNASGTTPSPSRYGGTREVGVDEAVLVHDDIYAEVIPDANGIHVRPLMCKLIYKTKGTDKVIIITDGMDTAGLPSEPGDPFEDVNYVEGLGLSGSRLTMDRAVRNMMRHTGAGIVDAFIMASLNPAKVLKLDKEMGSLEKGKRANIVIVTGDIEVKQVMLEGKLYKEG